jgi:hypothetical protein
MPLSLTELLSVTDPRGRPGIGGGPDWFLGREKEIIYDGTLIPLAEPIGNSFDGRAGGRIRNEILDLARRHCLPQ